MKIDRAYYEGYIWDGKKYYTLETIKKGVSAYISICGYYTVLFEDETDEQIGIVQESDVRTSWNHYFGSTCTYGWNGKKATKKEHVKHLCTRANYETALAMVLEEYKRRTK